MSSAPIPTTLTLLSHLPSHEIGSKVRFLGCIDAYDSRRGVLELLHSYPSTAKTTVVAEIDVNIILETVKREDLELGAWVNVMGYVTEHRADRSVTKALKGTENVPSEKAIMAIQAIMLWNAGSINLANYEKAVSQRLQSMGKEERA